MSSYGWYNHPVKGWIREKNKSLERPQSETMLERRAARTRARREDPDHDENVKRRRNESILRLLNNKSYQNVPLPEGNRVIAHLASINICSVEDYLSFGIGPEGRGDNWRWILDSFIETFHDRGVPQNEQMELIFHLGQIHFSLEDVRDLRDDVIQERFDDKMRWTGPPASSVEKPRNPNRGIWRFGTSKWLQERDFFSDSDHSCPRTHFYCHLNFIC